MSGELFEESWLRAWKNLGYMAPAGLMQQLLAAYAEPQRHYHTGQHLAECLQGLGPLLHDAQHPGELELALWFHDAIYEVRAQDNELRSADWARSTLLAAGSTADAADRVHALIMATCHKVPPSSADAKLLVDVDLAILGAEPERFEEYEQQVRREYAWVPGWLYRRKRRAVLQSFLDREVIYDNATLRALLEARARANLRHSISKR